MRWHYSRMMPSGATVKIGVWEDGNFIGAIIFGMGASPYYGKKFGLVNQEVCELVRVALKEHRAPVTKMIAIAIKMLKRKCPGLRLIVSFADMDQDHEGIIYKAGNWIYEGVTAEGYGKAYLIHGRKVHNRTISGGHFYQAGGGDRKENLKALQEKYGAENVKPYYSKGKHKYLYFLDKKLEQDLRGRSVIG